MLYTILVLYLEKDVVELRKIQRRQQKLLKGLNGVVGFWDQTKNFETFQLGECCGETWFYEIMKVAEKMNMVPFFIKSQSLAHLVKLG